MVGVAFCPSKKFSHPKGRLNISLKSTTIAFAQLKENIMKRLLCCFLSIFTLSAGSSMALAENTVDKAVMPPALVQCQSEKDCDRNAKHLEQFVADFYKWYAASSEFTFSHALHKLPREEFLKRKREHTEQEDQILKTMLSPSFYAWIFTFDKNGERAPNYKYCSDDVNFITCSQDNLKVWMTYTTAQLIAKDSNSAVLIVRMPSSENRSSQNRMPLLVSVQLKVLNGAWKIDGTRWLPTD
jgi:hypothetical protein